MSAPTPAPPTPPTPADVKAAFRWFLVGFGLLGLCVGYLAGASDSPVVGVVLPLLFGLVSGGAGFLAAGADPASPRTTARLRVLGMSLVVFLLPFLAGSAYGIMLRTGLGVSSFLPRSQLVAPQPAAIPGLGAKSTPEALTLLAMRGRLRALGASDAEQAIVLDRLTKEGSDVGPPPEFAPTLRRLAGLAEKVRAAIPDAAGDDKPPPRLDRLAPLLDAYVRDFKHLSERIDGGERTPTVLVVYYLTQFNKDLGGEADFARLEHDELAYLAKHDALRQELAELRWQLVQEEDRVAANPAVNGSAAVQEADRFLGLFSGAPARDEGLPIEKPHLGPAFAP